MGQKSLLVTSPGPHLMSPLSSGKWVCISKFCCRLPASQDPFPETKGSRSVPKSATDLGAGRLQPL